MEKKRAETTSGSLFFFAGSPGASPLGPWFFLASEEQPLAIGRLMDLEAPVPFGCPVDAWSTMDLWSTCEVCGITSGDD